MLTKLVAPMKFLLLAVTVGLLALPDRTPLPTFAQSASVATMSTAWDFPITPQQRWTLLPLFAARDKSIAKLEGKEMRRTFRALGLEPIYKTLLHNKDRVSSKLAIDDAPRLHRLKLENVEFILEKVLSGERPRMTELVCGDFFDQLEDARVKRDDDTWAPLLAGGETAYDPASEDWRPSPEGPLDVGDAEIVCPHCGKASLCTGEHLIGGPKAEAPPVAA
jgi:hypothetical protein